MQNVSGLGASCLGRCSSMGRRSNETIFDKDTIEGVASIHGDIHEGQHHQSFEKKQHLPQQMSFLKPTWNFCETSVLF